MIKLRDRKIEKWSKDSANCMINYNILYIQFLSKIQLLPLLSIQFQIRLPNSPYFLEKNAIPVATRQILNHFKHVSTNLTSVT